MGPIMKVKELAKMLALFDPEVKVYVRLDNGQIFDTDSNEEHADYNDGVEPDFYLLGIGADHES